MTDDERTAQPQGETVLAAAGGPFQCFPPARSPKGITSSRIDPLTDKQESTVVSRGMGLPVLIHRPLVDPSSRGTAR